MNFTDQQQLAQDSKFQGFVLIGASRFANDFLETEKVFDTIDNTDPINPVSINQDANIYLNKMHNFAVRVLNMQANRQGGLVNSIQNAFIIVLVDLVPNLAIEQLADTEGFIQGNMEALEGVMKVVFERLSGVTQKEKQEYDSL